MRRSARATVRLRPAPGVSYATDTRAPPLLLRQGTTARRRLIFDQLAGPTGRLEIRRYNSVSMDATLTALHRLIEIVDRLRSPGGCPWDQKQTLRDMSRHMTEEVAEVADAIDDSGGEPTEHVGEELGDVLMNVVLAARIAQESSTFDLRTVADGISDKLIRRHPHVFGETEVGGVDEVLANWQAIKAEEKAARGTAGPESRLDSVARHLSPLARAYELGRRAAKSGFDWPDIAPALDKVQEELTEVRDELHRAASDSSIQDEHGVADELGDLLFSVTVLCRKAGVRPDDALRRTNRKFAARFSALEKRFDDLESRSLPELEAAWRQAKVTPPSPPVTPEA